MKLGPLENMKKLIQAIQARKELRQKGISNLMSKRGEERNLSIEEGHAITETYIVDWQNEVEFLEKILCTIADNLTWISVKDQLPPRKEDWDHSEQVVVYYPAEEGGKTWGYGIAYYHYNPPFAKPGFTDFSDTRQPTYWKPLERPADIELLE